MSMILLGMAQQSRVIYKGIQRHLIPMSALSKGRELILLYSQVSSMIETPFDGLCFMITS